MTIPAVRNIRCRRPVLFTLLWNAVLLAQTGTAGKSISVKASDYGARGGAREIAGAAIQQKSRVLRSAARAFTPADVGKAIEVAGAGSGAEQLITTIASVTSTTSVVLNAVAGRTVNDAAAVVGTDDSDSIQRAMAAASESGQPLQFPKDTYYTRSRWIIDKPITIIGNGSRLLFGVRGGTNTSSGLLIQSPTKLTVAFTAVLKAGATLVELPSVTGLRVGEDIMLVLGADPYDAAQPYLSQFNKIAGISGNRLTLAAPVQEDISGNRHLLVTFNSIAENIAVGGFDLDAPIRLYRARNIVLSNLQINYAASGLSVQYSSDVLANALQMNQIADTNAIDLVQNYNLTGRGIRIQNIAAPIGIRTAAQNRGIKLENIFIGSQTASKGLIGIQALGHSTGVVVRNYHFKPSDQDTSVIIPLQIGEQSDARSENLYLEAMPVQSYQDLTTHIGELQYGGVLYRQIETRTMVVPLSPNMTNVRVPVPDGITKGIKFFIKDKTGLTAVKALQGGGAAFNLAKDLTPGLPASGVASRISGTSWVGAVGPQFAFNQSTPPFALTGKTIRITTGAQIPRDDYLTMEVEYYPLPYERVDKLAQIISSGLFLLTIVILATRSLVRRLRPVKAA